MIPNNEDDLDSTQSSDHLQWDDSPEQYQLDETIQGLEQAIEPRRLFPDVDDDDHVDEPLTSEDLTDDEVFNRDKFETPPTAPKLKRNNAMRNKERPQVENREKSEPRVTRQMLSNPSSPYNLNLNARQNLENVLNPNIPIIPDLVELGPQVQNFEIALEGVQNQTRRSARDRKPINYVTWNEEGRRN